MLNGEGIIITLIVGFDKKDLINEYYHHYFPSSVFSIISIL